MKIIAILALVVSTVALIIAFHTLRSRAEVLQSLQSEVAQAHTRLRDSELKLAEVSARLADIQKRYAGVSQPVPSVVPHDTATARLPLLAGGSYSVERNAIVYAPDARLRVGDNAAVRSPTGVMVSDLEQKMIVGDLAMETPNGTVQADGAVVDVRAQKMTAKRMTFTAKKEPNKAPEPRRQSQRRDLSRFLQNQESRQVPSWLIFDVGQKAFAMRRSKCNFRNGDFALEVFERTAKNASRHSLDSLRFGRLQRKSAKRVQISEVKR